MRQIETCISFTFTSIHTNKQRCANDKYTYHDKQMQAKEGYKLWNTQFLILAQ